MTVRFRLPFVSAKRVLRAALVLVIYTSVGAGLSPARSDDFPSRPIRLIVPFPAGSSADLVGRTIAQRLSQQIHQAVVVDNRSGAGGVIGQDAVARSPADGYTLGLATVSTLAVAQITDVMLLAFSESVVGEEAQEADSSGRSLGSSWGDGAAICCWRM